MLIHSLCEGSDVTLDTNVLVHASRPSAREHESGLAVLEWLRQADPSTTWVLDDTGKKAPDAVTSVLYMEYLKHVPKQGLAFVLLSHFLRQGRVTWAPRPDERQRNLIRQLVPANKKDQAVLGAACSSKSQVLVTNDRTDFSDSTRANIRKSLKVRVLDSHEAAA